MTKRLHGTTNMLYLWGQVSKVIISISIDLGVNQSGGYQHIYPPVQVCQTRGCPNHRTTNKVKTLGDPVKYKGSLFTLRKGAVPVYHTSLYCSSK